MTNWYQCVIILLVICHCCFCNVESAATRCSVDDRDQYKVHKWSKEIFNLPISTTLRCDDVCSQHCSWRYGQNHISSSSEVTLTSVSNDYGEYSCYKVSQVVRKVLVIPGNDSFTCSKCLSSSVCVNGEEVTVSFTIHIDECFIRIQECEVLQNGLYPVCMIGSGNCSFIFKISEDYVVNCPILNTSYAIRSEKIDLNGDLQPCMTENVITTDTIVIPMTTLPSVTNTTNILPSTSNIVMNPSNTPSLENDSASSFRTVATALGTLILLLLLIALIVFTVLFWYFNKSKRQQSVRGNNSAGNIIRLEDESDNVDIGSDVVSDISTDVSIDVAHKDTTSLVDQSRSIQVLQPSNESIPVFVLYNNDCSVENVMDFNELLRSSYGIKVDADVYHIDENPDDWSLWVEKQLLNCIDNNGLIILLWSAGLKIPLQDESQNCRIQMSSGHIFVHH
ncbi:uncharacterized protein [Dysidea avara]|uniref:uncharacterized protein isoform X2 n=1 Tax=Dysidea avara TaxID=196820 RepID=UPI003324D9E5